MMNNKTIVAPQKRRRNDILLIAGILSAILIFALIYSLTRKDGAYAVVLKNNEEIGRYSLAEDIEIPINTGDKVTNILLIEDGKAQMKSAVCPDKICVNHRPIDKSGQTIVCLPEKVVIKIIAESGGNAPDTVA